MSDQPKKDRPLSEISHLFLSSLRARQTGGAPAPQRKPPPSTAQHAHSSVDLTPEEFAEAFAEAEKNGHERGTARAVPPVTAVIGTHLNVQLFDRAKEYAAHLCGSGARIGLIEVDAAEFRVMLFERDATSAGASTTSETPGEAFDLRRMSEAIEELNCDVDRWLLLLPNPRSADARPILRMINHWVLLCTCDHDGIVACYRTIKGLVESDRPKLSLAVLGAADQEQARGVFQKLASVCDQFLHWPLQPEPGVQRAADVAEHLVLRCGASRTADACSGLQWQAVSNFLTKNKTEKLTQMDPIQQNPVIEKKRVLADVVVSQEERAEKILPNPIFRSESATPDDVIDLESDANPAAIVRAIIQSATPPTRLIECPIKPPMCPDATLAVGSDYRLILLAVARAGLSDMRSIGRAYQWLMENRALVAMALPQLAIDAHQLPQLRLIVDQADLTAEILQPMLQSSSVTVQAYRKLRWAGRTGLLLNAA